MKLLADIIDPNEITGFSREEVDAFDAAPNTLADVFPNETTDSITVSWTIDGKNEDVAAYRAFDAEAKIGGSRGGEKVTGELAPLSIKRRFSEYDQLVRRGVNSPETVQVAADRLATEVAKATVNRLILARGEALATGKLVIHDEEFKQSADFGRRADFTATAATLWDADGDPFADLDTWLTAYEAENGFLPDRIRISRRIAAVLMRSAKVRAYVGPSAPTMITLADINARMASQGFPALEVFNARISGKAVLPESSVIFDAGTAGATVWGPTLEAADPAYGIAYSDQPGIVVGAYATEDPKTTWIRSNAVVLPILGNANATFAAKVVA